MSDARPWQHREQLPSVHSCVGIHRDGHWRHLLCLLDLVAWACTCLSRGSALASSTSTPLTTAYLNIIPLSVPAVQPRSAGLLPLKDFRPHGPSSHRCVCVTPHGHIPWQQKTCQRGQHRCEDIHVDPVAPFDCTCMPSPSSHLVLLHLSRFRCFTLREKHKLRFTAAALCDSKFGPNR